jgi:NADH:ubiquinone oxidoreductase subunit 6 (subunit J)
MTKAKMDRADLFLTTGVVAYMTALGTCVVIAMLGTDSESVHRAIWLLLGIPMAIPGIIFMLVFTAFLVNSLTGLPLIGYANGLSTVKRNWQSIGGAVLLLSVWCAAIGAATA